MANTKNELAPSSVLTPTARRWILHHDESWLFTIAYVGLAVVLSSYISLFWLIVMVAVHGVLEWVRQQHLGQGFRGVLWEIKLDVSLVLTAMVLTAYMDVVLGAAGLGGAARLGVRTATRATGWSRSLRGILLSVDDAVQVARVAAKRGPVEDAPASRGWTVGDHIGIWLGAVCLLLIVAAPLLTHHTISTLASTLLAELHPWPGE